MNSAQELQALAGAIRDLQRRAFVGGGALATIIETRGSTFRRAGASMLILGDGSIVCELAGGCPQRDIVLRAQEVMADGHARLVHYNRDTNYDILIELGCGGELSVLIEPLLGECHIEHLDALEGCLARRDVGAMAMVFAHDDGNLLPNPRRLLANGNGVLFDGIGDDALGAQLLHRIENLERRVEPFTSGDGRVHGLVEQMHPCPSLVLIGANAGARAMAEMALALGWQVTLVDTDAERLKSLALPLPIETMAVGPAALRAALSPDSFTAVMAMTHRYELDVDYLSALGNSELAYVGAIGSRERAQRMHRALNGHFDRLHVPAGLDIGSETPQEIALAVIAEIVATFNMREGQRLIDTRGPIHS